MAKTAAEKMPPLQKAYRQRYKEAKAGLDAARAVVRRLQSNAPVTRDGNGNAPKVTVTRVTKPEGNAPVTPGNLVAGRTLQVYDDDPLAVYSPERWAFLSSCGHVWQPSLGYSTRPGPNGTTIRGVTVPGDPGYQGVGQDKAHSVVV